jgi:hypothetical protein
MVWYDERGYSPPKDATLVLLEPGERVRPWWWGLIDLATIAVAMIVGLFIGVWMMAHK